MRTIALVLGIVGGAFGVIAGLLYMTPVVGIAAGGGSEVGRGFVAVLAGLAGTLGGALALRYPKVSSTILEGITGVGGFIIISVLWIFSGSLLIAGALLAYFAGERGPLTLR